MSMMLQQADAAPERPVIALMGEFSAGKSTLCNLLIGSSPLPTKVTATHLPPVWVTYGEGEPVAVKVDGTAAPVDPHKLYDLDLETTSYVKIFYKSDILEMCDVIDMPGISDPNMSSEIWERVLHFAHGVIWCTHATQAWRQSEAAVWETFPEHLRANSILLITRFDKLMTVRDKQRVLYRLEKETEGLFAHRFPVSLLQAINAEDDHDAWVSSGAEAFAQALIDMVARLKTGETQPSQPAVVPARPHAVAADAAPQREAPVDAAPGASVMPRRVRRVTPGGDATPRRPGPDVSVGG